MPDYLRQTPEQRAMVERWLGRMRKRFAGARDASEIGRVLARERHLETLNQPLPMSAQRHAKLEAEVADVHAAGGLADAGRGRATPRGHPRRLDPAGARQ